LYMKEIHFRYPMFPEQHASNDRRSKVKLRRIHCQCSW